MADLRIVDAPVLLQESITDDVKMPTGGLGNFSVRLGDILWYVITKEQLANKNYVDLSSKGVKDSLDEHIADKNNPHNVTKVQVGLGNVDNTADIDKPVSNAAKSAIITATTDMATKAYVNQKDNLKADKATTLGGYGITDAYTKTETDNKIDALSGTSYAGHKGYTTLALAQAAQASLPANTIVEVTNDPDKNKNGVYLWDGTTLIKYNEEDTSQKINLVKNQINDNYTAFIEFLKLYCVDSSDKADDLIQKINLVKNQINDNYTAFIEFLKLYNNGSMVNSFSVAPSFSADMQIPTDKFDVSKGNLQGVVLGLGASGTFDEGMVESPYIIYDNNLKKFVMVYTAYDVNHVATIGWATSTDLVAWTKQGKLISPSGNSANGDAHGMTGPCLYYYKGLYYLYYIGLNGAGYEGEPINMCLATTASLTSPSWTYHGIKIPIQTNIAWANEAIYHPNLFTYNGKWYMFFNARGSINGDRAERFGFATSNNIDGEWTVNPTRVSQPLERDNTVIRAGDPAVFEYNGLIYVFYFRILPNGTAIDSWGWTTPSEFPFGWRFGGDLLATNVDYQSQYAHKPFVVKYQNKLYHYYTAVGSQGRVIALKTYDI